jgi:hypothetical protein
VGIRLPILQKGSVSVLHWVLPMLVNVFLPQQNQYLLYSRLPSLERRLLPQLPGMRTHLTHVKTSTIHQSLQSLISIAIMDPQASESSKRSFNNPPPSDLKLKLGGKTLHVHRIVLCRKSGYFNSLLTGRSKV